MRACLLSIPTCAESEDGRRTPANFAIRWPTPTGMALLIETSFGSKHGNHMLIGPYLTAYLPTCPPTYLTTYLTTYLQYLPTYVHTGEYII